MNWTKYNIYVLAAILISFSFVLSELQITPGIKNPHVDESQYFAYAYNLHRNGVFSDDRTKAAVKPDALRTPAYPAVLAVMMKLFDVQQDLTCYLYDRPPCLEIHKTLKRVNVPFFLTLVCVTFLIIHAIIQNKGVAFACATWVAVGFSGYVDRYLTEILASLLLLIHSYFLYRLAQKPSHWPTGLAAGCSLALLVLTRAVFFYWAVMLTSGISVILLGRILRSSFSQATVFNKATIIRPLIVLLISTWLLPGLWMTRNYVSTGSPVIRAGGGSVVLGVRAEYGKISWKEYLAGFAVFTPGVGTIVMSLFPPAYVARFDTNNPDGFEGPVRKMAYALEFPELWRKTTGRGANPLSSEFRMGHVGTRLPSVGHLTEGALKKAAIETMISDWYKQAALVPFFAYRGAFFYFSNSHPDQLAWRIVFGFLSSSGFLLFVFLLVVLIRSFSARNWPMIVLFAPTVYSFAFHAVITHYSPRYSTPLVPVLLIAGGWVAAGLLKRFRRKAGFDPA
ncbi:MAG: hypothetical protein O7G83_16130 [Proteobacteria bacterium]|nr:hypothetical protein [Pseudomonadota bacterium]